MKRFLMLLPVIFMLVACDSSSGDDSPRYVKSAKSDLESALVANIFKDPNFTCQSIPANNDSWSIGCFERVKKPSVFLLFAVYEDAGKANPPFIYKLYAVNGKARQYANSEALRMFKIDTDNKITTDIPAVIDAYINKFVEQ